MIPVRILSGSSTLVSALASVSITTIKMAPSKILTGIAFVLSGPVSILAKCGITSPTQPIVPLMHTADAVSKVAQMIIKFRTTVTETPSVFAYLSPSERILILHLRRKIITDATMITGPTVTRSFGNTFVGLPSCQ